VGRQPLVESIDGELTSTQVAVAPAMLSGIEPISARSLHWAPVRRSVCSSRSTGTRARDPETAITDVR